MNHRRWLGTATVPLVVLLATETARAGLVFPGPGIQTINMGGGNPAVPAVPPQPGPAVRPPAAALSAATNSGDVPAPNWEGVEVESDLTHMGALPFAPPAGNFLQIRREREFNIVGAPTLVQFAASLRGVLNVATGAGGFANLSVTVARSRVVDAANNTIFNFSGAKANIIDVGANSPAAQTKVGPSAFLEKCLPVGAYRIFSDLLITFSHNNATVDYRFLDPLIGPDGLGSKDAAGKDDQYGLEAVVRAKDKPPPDVKDIREGPTAGSEGNPEISYDAATGTLSFAPGQINVLDLVGGKSGAIDPAFAADPLAGATMSISDLLFQGFNPDGSAQFSGGTVTIADSNANIFLTGSFSGYRVGDTTKTDLLDSYGVFDDLSFDNNGLDSPFLDAFFQAAKDNPTTTTMDFYFITGQGLAAATNNFTTSATLDASYYVGPSAVPEPSTLAMLAFGAIALAGLGRSPLRRRLADRRKR